MAATAFSTSSPMQSSVLETSHLRYFLRPATTGVRRNSSVTPLGRPRWEVSRTLAPLSTRNWMVGMAPRMRVSSVMFLSASIGTFRSARTNTRLPSRSSLVRSDTDFFTASTFTVRRAWALETGRAANTDCMEAPLRAPPKAAALDAMRAALGAATAATLVDFLATGAWALATVGRKATVVAAISMCLVWVERVENGYGTVCSRGGAFE
mmetsp:Transcript_27165/g.59368  ORF Transcript_27165/g.59368 Transcript_27165/m.59368 type:complete len:209 (+) Transcript_27165:1015-1641(+)